MNMNVYRCDGALLAIDCGIGFGDAANPEVEVMMPDPAWLVARKAQLRALVITHAHEDHIGAIAWTWPLLGCPVYLSPFALAVAKRKLAERGITGARLLPLAPGTRIELAPFTIEAIHVAHSIPEAYALAIRTPHGVVLHTGDFKLDPDPLIGPPTDEAALAALGEEGVLAMVCDSTNALVEGHSGSEADVRRSLAALVRGLSGRVAVTCFATNVARVESVALAAKAAGRRVVMAGRSLRNIVAASAETGYLRKLPPFIEEQEAGYLPDDALLLLCAGSQGEPRSALARLAADSHPHLAVGEDDTVIFSSRVIPGNERAIMKVQDDFARRGVRVMTAEDHAVHVSGHPARDELRRIYRLVKPRFSVPTHGEYRHMAEHAALAEEAGAETIILEDGDVLRLAPGGLKVVDSAEVGRLAVDGERLLALSGAALAARRRMLVNGAVMASLVLDGSGRLLAPPAVSAPGLFDDEREVAALAARLGAAVGDLPGAIRRDDDALREAARGALRRAVNQELHKRPAVEVHLLRVSV
ncbi:MAG: ribonuclease J [Acetobacteraceae bacterium]|nr:ribonuclease J [Acetobacteraceae bacterium]